VNTEQIANLIQEKEDLIYQFKQQDNADYHEILAGRLNEFQAKKRREERVIQIQSLEAEIEQLKLQLGNEQLVGWIEINDVFWKAQEKNALTNPTKYFNGGSPNWGLIVNKIIPERNQVGKILLNLQEAAEAQDTPILLLTGPSGEGKSTAIQQVIYQLAQLRQWKILWRESEKIEFTSVEKVVDYVLSQPVSDLTWLICSDEAKPLFSTLNTAIAKLREAKRSDILFLFSCRSIDWQRSPVKNLLYSSCKEIPMIGIDHSDAKQIVKAWKDYNALETLEADSEEVATDKLLKAAHGGSSYDSFLGAMLTVRVGKNLERFVRSILSQLAELQTETHIKLLDAFIYIAVIHALGLKKELLTDTVLAGILKVSPEHIHEMIVALGREAAATLDGDYIVTRHIKIAQAAVRILNNEYEQLANKRLVLITRRAIDGFVRRKFVNREIGRWNYLSKDVFKIDQNLGIQVAKAACEADEKDAFLVVNHATLYRLAGKPKEAIEVLKEGGNIVREIHRAYYYEWATNEGKLHNREADIYLSAISVCDQVKDDLTGPSAKMSLRGMSNAFYTLSDLVQSSQLSRIYLFAAGATVQMGLALPVGERATETTQVRLEELAHKIGEKEKSALTINMGNFMRGVSAAYDAIKTPFPNWVPNGKKLSFKNLQSVVNRYT